MAINNNTTLTELAVLVAEALSDAGLSATLVGGGAAAIHSNEKNLSRDLDFISTASTEQIDDALTPLGFKRDGDKFYRHENSSLIIEFPSPPLAIGNFYIQDTNKLTLDGVDIQIISATESVMDRLAAFFHWNDRQALSTAILVANTNEIDWEFVRSWAEKEGEIEKFELFFSKLKEDPQ